MNIIIVNVPPIRDEERVIILDSDDDYRRLKHSKIYRADWICVRGGRVIKDKLSHG